MAKMKNVNATPIINVDSFRYRMAEISSKNYFLHPNYSNLVTDALRNVYPIKIIGDIVETMMWINAIKYKLEYEGKYNGKKK